MANHNREFDAEAAKKAHSIVIEKIELYERLQQKVGEGDLSFAPAFGLMSSGQNGQAFQNYSGMHETIWNNLDAQRRAGYALLSALESGMKRHGITEFESVRELDALTQEDSAE